MPEVPPILLSAVVCERVIFDKITGMPSLINIIQTLKAPAYPVRQDQMVFFCELTNGHGICSSRVRIIEADRKDRVIFEQQGNVEFKDVQQVVTLAVNLRGIVFQNPGEYRFQLFFGEQLLGERRLACRHVKPPARDDKSAD